MKCSWHGYYARLRRRISQLSDPRGTRVYAISSRNAQGRLNPPEFPDAGSRLTGRNRTASLLDEATAAAEAMTLLHAVQAKGGPGTPIVLGIRTNLPQYSSAEGTRRTSRINIVLRSRCARLATTGRRVRAVRDETARLQTKAVRCPHMSRTYLGLSTDLLGSACDAAGGNRADGCWKRTRFGVRGVRGPHAAVYRHAGIVLCARSGGISASPSCDATWPFDALQTRAHIRREKATSNI